MRIGVHVQRGVGLEDSVRRAAGFGCEAIQIFAANPSAWRSPEVKAETAAGLRAAVKELDLRPVLVHTPYLLNLASPDAAIHSKSVAALRDNLHRADVLGADFVVTHIGSHRGSGVEQGIERICGGVAEALAGTGVALLLEHSAGTGDSVGSTFEELRIILDCLDAHRERLGICLDAAHLWGAGYDVSTPRALARTMTEFDAIVGLERLKVMHLNDTHMGLGSKRDRHAGIGTGLIGVEGFRAIVNYPAFRDLAGIVETPMQSIEDHERDVRLLRDLRDSGAGPL